MSLEPIDPETALELYLADRENNVTDATIYSHRSRLGHFVKWCDKQGITNLNELTGRQLHDRVVRNHFRPVFASRESHVLKHEVCDSMAVTNYARPYEYRLWRRDDGDLTTATEKTQMDTLRVFIRWLESIDGVPEDLHVKVRSPNLTGGDNIRDVMLDDERAEEVLGYLRRYEYASRPHVVLALMWHTMMRVGAIRALDCEDYNADEQSLEVVHRPETGTPIKNAEDGERYIALSNEICKVLDDWLADRRPDVTTEEGRRPLIATPQGRAHTTTRRNDCYRYTRPCISSGTCPHGRDLDNCPATAYDSASECPSSVSPHALRRGGITHALQQDWPMKAVGDRANVSEQVLELHYDQRSEEAKMEQRREYLDEL